MARRVAERGAEAEVIALDAAPLGSAADGAPPAGEWDEAALLARALADVLPVSAEELRALDPAARVGYLVRRAGEPGALPADLRRIFDPRAAERLLRVFSANLRAAERYRPEPAPVRVVLFQAAESRHLPERDPGAAWRRVALGGVEVVRVPGDHRTLVLGENARALGRALMRCLEAPGVRTG
jgi:thioesterase domain-containing protein